MKRFLSILTVLLILPFISLTAIELEGYNISKKLISLEKSGPPEIVDNYIVLSLESNDKPLFIGAAFEHENYTKIHQYKKIKGENIYYLVINKPDINEIKYRVIVDGIWQADPHSEKIQQMSNGVKLSVFPLPSVPDNEARYPQTKEKYTFFYHKGKPGSSVYIAGSFNNWDPFMYRMKEKDSGEYYFKVRLKPGEHFYYFLENGVKMSDKRNPVLVWDKEFGEVSGYVLGSK